MQEKAVVDAGTAAATAAILTVSPAAGDYALIVISALVGGLVSLSRAQLGTSAESAWYLFRCIAFAAGTAKLVSVALVSQIDALSGVDHNEILIAVSFAIACIGDDWLRFRDLVPTVADGLKARVKKWLE